MSTSRRTVPLFAPTFIDDLDERGLNENVLLVITGDFGRTPRINKRAGRDHWGHLCTLALAGGGYKMGEVIGKSDARASYPAADQIGSQELTATIMHSLIDIPNPRYASFNHADHATLLSL